MAISGSDSYGAFFDTGTSTTVTPRAYTETEVHIASREIDTGASIPSGQTIATFHPRGVPHRGGNSPR